MLVLTRKAGEKILIGDDIVITLVRIHRDKIRLGVEAPPHVSVQREEVRARVARGADGEAGAADGGPGGELART